METREEVRALCAKIGSQTAAAAAVGVSESLMKKWSAGHRIPSPERLADLRAAAGKVSPTSAGYPSPNVPGFIRKYSDKEYDSAAHGFSLEGTAGADDEDFQRGRVGVFFNRNEAGTFWLEEKEIRMIAEQFAEAVAELDARGIGEEPA